MGVLRLFSLILLNPIHWDVPAECPTWQQVEDEIAVLHPSRTVSELPFELDVQIRAHKEGWQLSLRINDDEEHNPPPTTDCGELAAITASLIVTKLDTLLFSEFPEGEMSEGEAHSDEDSMEELVVDEPPLSPSSGQYTEHTGLGKLPLQSQGYVSMRGGTSLGLTATALPRVSVHSGVALGGVKKTALRLGASGDGSFATQAPGLRRAWSVGAELAGAFSNKRARFMLGAGCSAGRMDFDYEGERAHAPWVRSQINFSGGFATGPSKSLTILLEFGLDILLYGRPLTVQVDGRERLSYDPPPVFFHTQLGFDWQGPRRHKRSRPRVQQRSLELETGDQRVGAVAVEALDDPAAAVVIDAAHARRTE
ncbi:MAG: hypothetical protein KC457_13320 [Myxococcales bacterium]|nr:hypothetical protein [Myxococcales bacterium]